MMSKGIKVLGSSILAASLVFGASGMHLARAAGTEQPVNVLTVVDESADRMKVDGINQTNNDNKLILFNDNFSYYTETKKGSLEVVLEKTALHTYRVAKITNGDSAIPENGLVLSTGTATASGSIKDFLLQLKQGETVKMYEPMVKREQRQSQAVNPTRESNPDGAAFDGFRGPDQLIVYTPEFGPSTKTNPYGYEITVVDGYVTKLGGGNSSIPANGFVVSGHGKSSAWLSSSSIIGAKATIDANGAVTIVQDVDSYQFQSEQAIQQAEASIAKAKEQYLDVAYEKADESIQSARSFIREADLIKTSDPAKALDYVRQAAQRAYDAYYYSLPSEVAEQRAIWYRPEEITLQGVREVLDRMEKAGFNSVYLETTFHGYTIYPSEVMAAYGLPEQHPNFRNGDYGPYGKDLLNAYIAEGKKRGITVQAWTDGFMIGHESLGLPPELQKYPEWAAIQRNNTSGKPLPDTSSKYYWLDIAQPEVQTFMLDIYREMQSNYEIKGLNIDYMRFPHQDFERSYSFSKNVRALYEAQYGVDPYQLSPTETSEQWKAWTNWLIEQEDQFVDKLYKQTKSRNAKFMLTATPEPGAEAALISHWKLDGVIPQAYGHDFNSIQKTVQDSKKLMPEGTMYYTGIYSFYHHLSEMAAVNDVLSGKHGTMGVNMFAFGQASAPSVDALGKGPWREKAVNPGEEPVKATVAQLKKIAEQMTHIYIPQGAVERHTGIAIKQAVNQLQANAGKSSLSEPAGYDELLALIQQAKTSSDLNEKVAERLTEQLQNCKLWLSYESDRQG